MCIVHNRVNNNKGERKTNNNKYSTLNKTKINNQNNIKFLTCKASNSFETVRTTLKLSGRLCNCPDGFRMGLWF